MMLDNEKAIDAAVQEVEDTFCGKILFPGPAWNALFGWSQVMPDALVNK